MHIDRIRERAQEAQHGKNPESDSSLVRQPGEVASPSPEAAQPPLSQVEQERADDEGMVRQDVE